MLKRWPAFTRFLENGRICLTNNAAERALRGVALGRKAWLFCGSDRGGLRAAVMYTLIGTAKLNSIDPQAWLADASSASPACRCRACRSSCRGPGTRQPSQPPSAAPPDLNTSRPTAQHPTRGAHRTGTDQIPYSSVKVDLPKIPKVQSRPKGVEDSLPAAHTVPNRF
jgi:Transposase IS66 family